MSGSFATPWTVARQAPLFMGFPRQEYWSGLLFPSHPVVILVCKIVSFFKKSFYTETKRTVNFVLCLYFKLTTPYVLCL